MFCFCFSPLFSFIYFLPLSPSLPYISLLIITMIIRKVSLYCWSDLSYHFDLIVTFRGPDERPELRTRRPDLAIWSRVTFISLSPSPYLVFLLIPPYASTTWFVSSVFLLLLLSLFFLSFPFISLNLPFSPWISLYLLFSLYLSIPIHFSFLPFLLSPCSPFLLLIWCIFHTFPTISNTDWD